jgi:hypothetical protein
MINETYKIFIEKELDETIGESRLLAETYPSRIYYVSGKRQYILKETKRIILNHQFANHKKLFEAWFDHKDLLAFKIPEPFLLGPGGAFILMEYVDGDNLLNLLLRKRKDVVDLFHRAGQALREYHDLARDSFADNVVDLRNCDSIREIMAGPKGPAVERALDSIPRDRFGIIYKDFSPSNVVVNQKGAMYFLDIQDSFYRAPLVYDWARFIDTTKVFSIVRKPSMIFSFDLVKQAINAFFNGYGGTVDEYFRAIQFVHRTEHVHIKITRTRMRGIILKLLYMFV